MVPHGSASTSLGLVNSCLYHDQLAKGCHQINNKSEIENMQTASNQQQPLTEKAKERLRMNAEAREREAKTVRLDIGQKRPYIFNAERILEAETKKRDDGSDYTVIPYVVIDERFPDHEKVFNASGQLSEKIDNLLGEGHKRLMVEKEKQGNTGRYNVYPLD
jgi:hypothetical protein